MRQSTSRVFIPFSSVKYHSSKGRSTVAAYGAPNTKERGRTYGRQTREFKESKRKNAV